MISQMELLGAICAELDRQGVKSLGVRQYNAIIRSANQMIADCEREPVMASAGMGLDAWRASDDVGLSSHYLASVLDGGFVREYAHPADGDDFGRCVRLLDAVPEFRERLEKMRTKSEEWSRLVDCWAEAESLYRTEKYKELSKIVRARKIAD